MNERVMQLRVGIVVVAAATITAILIVLFARPTFFQRQYTVFIKFPEAPGVHENTPVRKSGIQIGYVSDVQLEDDGVKLTLQIEDRYKLPVNETVRIGTGSLVTGDAMLEFVSAPQRSAKLITDGMYLSSGTVASNPMEVFVDLEDDIRQALGGITTAGNEVSALANRMNSLLSGNDQRFTEIMENAQTAMNNFNRAMIGMDQLFSDEGLNKDLRQSVQDLRGLFAKANETLTDTQETLKGFARVSQRAETNLANFENFTESFRGRGPELADSITNAVNNVDELLAQLVQISEAINSEDGSAGQFIRNPELFERLNRAAENVEEATRKLEPIMNDVRIMTDKLARDPRILGAKGALDRRSTGATLKLPFGQNRQ